MHIKTLVIYLLWYYLSAEVENINRLLSLKQLYHYVFVSCYTL